MSHVPALTIRPATSHDLVVLDRLAALDSQRPLTGPILVGERDGVVLAARSLSSGRTIADPFSPTADLVALLDVRAAARTASVRLRAPMLRRGPATA